MDLLGAWGFKYAEPLLGVSLSLGSYGIILYRKGFHYKRKAKEGNCHILLAPVVEWVDSLAQKKYLRFLADSLKLSDWVLRSEDWLYSGEMGDLGTLQILMDVQDPAPVISLNLTDFLLRKRDVNEIDLLTVRGIGFDETF